MGRSECSRSYGFELRRAIVVDNHSEKYKTRNVAAQRTIAGHTFLCLGRCDRGYVDFAIVLREFHDAIGQSIQRESPAAANVGTGMELRAALAHNDATRTDALAAIHFDAAHLGIAVATVTARSLTFLMCHDQDLRKQVQKCKHIL